MKYLVIINAAPYHRPFFRRVGQAIRDRGHEVVYAVDSHYSEYLHPDDTLEGPVYCFSDYLEKNYERRELPDGYEHCNVWRALFSDIDRASYSRAHYRRREGFYTSVAANLLHFYDEIFRAEQIDCVTYECVSNSFVHFAYAVSRRYGATFVGYLSSRIPQRIDIIDREYMLYSRTPQYYAELRSGAREAPPAARRAVSDYLANFERSVPDYMTQLAYLLENPLRAYADRERFGRWARSLAYFAREARRHEFSYQIGNPLVAFPQQFVRECARWAKVRYLGRRVYEPVDLSAKYFLYPLQYHPESSSSINALFHVGELDNVRNISVSMPFGVELWVRDHPHAAGRQPLAFYEEVGKLPNVRVIGTEVPGKVLVRHARAIVTCTSTMGFEGVVMGKPVFTLGESAYAFHPLCRRIDSFENAFELFAAYGDIRSTPEEREAFVLAYFLSTIRGSYDLARSYTDAALAARVARLVEGEAARDGRYPMEHDEP